MGMTLTQKIMARHAGAERVKAGDMVNCKVDVLLMNDITFPPSLKEFRKIGKPVFDKEKVILVPDHFTPNKDIVSAEQAKVMRDFVKAEKITHYFEVGRMGIEHVLLPEEGLVAPGEMIIGADSHTCTYGAIGAFATGVGSTDAGVAMALGETWFKVPEAIKVVLTGKPAQWITGKDIVLELIGRIGVDGARYMSIEYTGDALPYLPMADRLTICNMAIEGGGKNGIFPYDEIAEAYVTGRVTKSFTPEQADEDAEYVQTIEINLAEMTPVVAFPHTPDNTRRMGEFNEKIEIDQVIIGSCTNGRFEDLEKAAELFKNHKVADFVRCIVIPGSQRVYEEANKAGFIDTFIQAGCAVSTPTCGPCLGGYMGIMAAGEKTVSTTNRNFVGRMGHVDSEIYLASPYVAAASAICGYIASPGEVQ